MKISTLSVKYNHLAQLIISALLLIACNGGGSSGAATNINYQSFSCQNTHNVAFPGVSGVRQVYGQESQVYVTGVAVQYGSNHAFLYKGPVLGGGSCAEFIYPSAPGRTVTMTSLYGPDNNGFGQVVVTGSYTTAETGIYAQLGLLYQGAEDGSTTAGYQTLLPTSLANRPSEVILNTLGHSTMGGMVVGNFDTNLALGRAFLYNIATQTYYELHKPGGAASITAYGIWYNGGTSYTIAGGYSDVNESGVDIGFVADWNSLNPTILTHFTSLNYNNLPADQAGTHFEGITTDDNGGYNLAADWQVPNQGKTLPAFAHLARNVDGSFAPAQWLAYPYFPGASWTSANTVYRNYILGLAQSGEPVANFGYVVTLPVMN